MIIMDEKIQQIINGLTRKTRAGELVWEFNPPYQRCSLLFGGTMIDVTESEIAFNDYEHSFDADTAELFALARTTAKEATEFMDKILEQLNHL